TYLANLLPSFPNFSSPNLDATSSSSSDGSGSITRADDLELRLAAQVTEVLPNGNLVITGSQEIRVNSELRDLQIAGVVRPEDITRSNTITLDKIANARVSYGGRGVITDAQDPSFFQQVLGLLTPF
ncbi:MAG: flagellar basal body L-ring protein FlgH, partial [Pseudomonadota bacterium]